MILLFLLTLPRLCKRLTFSCYPHVIALLCPHMKECPLPEQGNGPSLQCGVYLVEEFGEARKSAFVTNSEARDPWARIGEILDSSLSLKNL